MQKHQSVMRSSLKYAGTKKQADARASRLVRIFGAGIGVADVEMCLYSIEPNIIEHIKMAKIRPKGSSDIMNLSRPPFTSY